MPIPSTPQHTPIRASVSYTVGKPDKRADLSTSATSPNIGTLAQTTQTASIVGKDYQSATVSYGAQVSGAVLTGSVTIPFKGLPAPFQTFPSDSLFLDVNLYEMSPSTNGLALSSIQIIPQGFANGVTTPGPVLATGQQYTSFSALVKYTFVATSAVNAGSLSVAVSAVMLYTAG